MKINSLTSFSSQSFSDRVYLILLLATFLIAPFYSRDNLGGVSLDLPFNATVWIPVSALIAFILIKVSFASKWLKPYGMLILLALPVVIAGTSLVAGLVNPIEFYMRVAYIFGGILFLFALIQYVNTKKRLIDLFYILLLSIFFHSLVGVVHINGTMFFDGWIPVSANGAVLGIFQQPNVQASMMATGVALAAWLATDASYEQQSIPRKILIFVVAGMAAWEIVISGSRVGLLGMILSLLFIFIGRLPNIKNLYSPLLLLLISLGIGLGFGYKTTDGELKAYNKIEEMVTTSRDVRPDVYKISWDVFLRSPIVGHGIGSFQGEFQRERINYYANYPGQSIEDAPLFSHPHNELLLWLDEGGILSVAAILLAVALVIKLLISLGFKEGFSAFALLTPIALHTQVEFPLYQSSYHWLVFLVLLIPLFIGNLQVVEGFSHNWQRYLLRLSAIALFPLTIFFLIHSMIAQQGITNFIFGKGVTGVEEYQYAENNPYYKDYVDELLKRGMLRVAVKNKDPQLANDFIAWAERYYKIRPVQYMYIDLAIAYQQMDRVSEANKVINEGAAIYPKDPNLQYVKEKINNGEIVLPR